MSDEIIIQEEAIEAVITDNLAVVEVSEDATDISVEILNSDIVVPVVSEDIITVLEISEQGVPGPERNKTDEDFIMNGSRNFKLSKMPFPDSVSFFINGLKQVNNSFAVEIDTVIVYNEIELTTNDFISFSYQY